MHQLPILSLVNSNASHDGGDKVALNRVVRQRRRRMEHHLMGDARSIISLRNDDGI